MIQNAHITQLQSGINTTLTTLQQRFWIPSAHQRIKSIICKCVVCKKTSGKPYVIPDPPPLAESATQLLSVLLEWTLWVPCIFVPMKENARLVHLEIITDLTVECFLQAFRRFAGWWSLPKLLLSDNGSTFVAAAEELKSLLSSDYLTENLTRKESSGSSSPNAPHGLGAFGSGS